jgi:type VI protein secretion system component Hcp
LPQTLTGDAVAGERSLNVKRTTVARFGLPIAAGLVTSVVVAAFALGAGSPSQPPTPNSTGQPVGELVIDRPTGSTTIPVLSFSEGGSNPTTIGSSSSGSGAGKVSFSSLNLMTTVGAYMPEIRDALARGTQFPTAVMTATWGVAGSSATLKYELENVFIESDQVSGSGGGQAPSESISLAFGKVKWTFTDANGTVTHGWNIITNTPLP